MQAFHENRQPRDHYARIRTGLANERTLLAYIRTGLGFSVGGASALHFLSGSEALAAGLACFAFASTCLLLGTIRFLAVRAAIDEVEDGPDSHGGV